MQMGKEEGKNVMQVFVVGKMVKSMKDSSFCILNLPPYVIAGMNYITLPLPKFFFEFPFFLLIKYYRRKHGRFLFIAF